MKKLMVVVIVLMAGSRVFEANAQALEIEKNKVVERSEVPAKVLSAFANEFPEASKMMDAQTWHLHYVEGKGYAEPRTYRVEIDNNQLTFSGHYRPEGEFLNAKETKRGVNLPPTVTSSINKKYQGWDIVEKAEVKTIAKSRRDKTHFEVTVSKGQEKKMLTVSSKGKILAEKK